MNGLNSPLTTPFRLALASPFAAVIFAASIWGAAAVAQETAQPDAGPPLSELNQRHAKLNLELAETELAIAKQFNRELEDILAVNLPDELRTRTMKMKLIPKTAIERLKSNILIAKERVSIADSGSTGRSNQIRLRHAQEQARLIQMKLGEAIADRGVQSPAAQKLKIRKLQLQNEIAKLRLQLPDHPEYLIERIDILQWQIDSLADDFLQWEQRVAALEDQFDHAMKVKD